MILAEYPRSGGTWTAYLLSYCLNIPMVDLDSPTPKPSDPLRRELVSGKWQHFSHKDLIRIAKTHKLPSDINYLPQEKKILLLRDGRDVILSYFFYLNIPTRQKFYKKLKFFLPGYNKQKRLDNFIKSYVPQWCKYIQEHLDRSDYILRYEDLNSDAVAALNKLFADMKVSVSEEIIEHAVNLFSFENLSSGRKKGQEDRQAFTRKGISEGWKTEFKDCHKTAFKNADVDNILVKLGYEKSETW